ncbi:MAG: hypothetical protein Q7J76_07160 [Candidatus Brocadiaceae bacterium]|uniref:hypothetical protein n=1 Tax=Candidatus Wunengus sp. YC61 TaxID=3367698 RepID=UPI0027207FCB|nr:hypothetical protein [Candidatus Brocadiaceae bacterium]
MDDAPEEYQTKEIVLESGRSLSVSLCWVERSAPNKINEDGSAVLDPSYMCFKGR